VVLWDAYNHGMSNFVAVNLHREVAERVDRLAAIERRSRAQMTEILIEERLRHLAEQEQYGRRARARAEGRE
jgi:hypothetical protein